MSVRALLAGVALALSPTLLRADRCPTSKVDVADWPIVRSSRMPGFTLRLPRAFTRDSTSPVEGAPSAQWTDAARARLTLSHRGPTSTPISLPSSDDRASYTTCEDRVGAASATIVSYGEGPVFIVRAHIRWPDGETLDVDGSAPDHASVERLIAAVRTIRRTGA